MTAPTHLAADLAELEYGFMEKDQRVRLFGDLLVANALPAKYAAEVQGLVNDGWLSPAGDVLMTEDEEAEL